VGQDQVGQVAIESYFMKTESLPDEGEAFVVQRKPPAMQVVPKSFSYE
jgi:hypothetical protein